MVSVGAVLVLVPVEDPLHLQGFAQAVDRAEALPVAACRLVRDEDVRTLLQKALVDRREDGRTVAARETPRQMFPAPTRRMKVAGQK